MNDSTNDDMAAARSEANTASNDVTIREVRSFDDFPSWLSPDDLALFLYESLKPYEDPLEDVRQGITDALAPQNGKSGFVLVADIDEKVVGGLIMLSTGMKGYVPENLLLMVAVDPVTRGKGVGSQLIKRSFALADGDVKLHVEYNNPAKRLYERLGMTNKYAEMRYNK